MPFISVDIPACNSGWWAGAAIGSVPVQSFTDFELIVVEDGSATARGGGSSRLAIRVYSKSTKSTLAEYERCATQLTALLVIKKP